MFRILKHVSGSEEHFLCNKQIWFQTEAIAVLKFKISPIIVQGPIVQVPGALDKAVPLLNHYELTICYRQGLVEIVFVLQNM